VLRFPRTLSAAQALLFLGSLPRIGGQGQGAQLDAVFRALTRPVIRTPEQGADTSCGDGPRAFPTMILRTAIAYTWSS